MASSSNLPRSSSYDAWLTSQAPTATVTQHLEMDTPLPSIELPVEDLTEGPDLATRGRTQNSPDSSFNDRMEGRQRPHESHLNDTGEAWSAPFAFMDFFDYGSTLGINGFPPIHEDPFQLATPDPILDWVMSLEKPLDPIQGAPLPRADEKMYGPLIPQIAPEYQLINGCTRDPTDLESYMSEPGKGTTSSHLQSAPVSAKTIPGLDGIGPDIWAGSHFLPRFVRAAELPDEGLCYFYNDGSHCKTVIDGEAVNPYLGVTESGEPRKRLAIACVTCIENKIKCVPDYPCCVQCKKFGRICKFENV